MQVKKAFGEDGDRNDAASQNWPHQQTALLNVVDHVNSSRPLCRRWQAISDCAARHLRPFGGRSLAEGGDLRNGKAERRRRLSILAEPGPSSRRRRGLRVGKSGRKMGL